MSQGRGSQPEAVRALHTSLAAGLSYHLVLNKDRIPFSDAAQMIKDEARRWFGWDDEKE